MCVNHEFQPDLGAVRDYCANNTKVGVCGWSHIDACACVEGSCTYLQCNQDMNEDDGCSLEDFSKDEVAWVCGTEHYCNAENPCGNGTFCDYTSFHATPISGPPCGQCSPGKNESKDDAILSDAETLQDMPPTNTPSDADSSEILTTPPEAVISSAQRQNMSLSFVAFALLGMILSI